MIVTVNGERRELARRRYCRERGGAARCRRPEARGVAVALDGEVVSRGALGETPSWTDGALIEIVAAIQGWVMS